MLDRYLFAMLICREFGLDASKLTAVTTEALGQKARRPLDGGLKVGKAQAQLTSRLQAPAAGLSAMREALERGRAGVDQPRNIT